MQIITTAVIKGGTGKTATAASLAQLAAKEGRRVLCIDLDPQGTLSTILQADRSAPGAYDLLKGSAIHKTIQSTAQGLDVIAAAPGLATYPAKSYLLADALKPISKDYDLCFIDTPPSFGPLLFEALNAATGLIITLNADSASIQGQKYMLELAKNAKSNNKRLKVLGCIITMYDRRPIISRQLHDLIEENGSALHCPLLGTISRSVAILEANALRLNLFEYAPKSKPAQEYRAIYNKLFN